MTTERLGKNSPEDILFCGLTNSPGIWPRVRCFGNVLPKAQEPRTPPRGSCRRTAGHRRGDGGGRMGGCEDATSNPPELRMLFPFAPDLGILIRVGKESRIEMLKHYRMKNLQGGRGGSKSCSESHRSGGGGISLSTGTSHSPSPSLSSTQLVPPPY